VTRRQILVAAMFAVLAIGVTAVSVLATGQGGAATPEAAVVEFFEATGSGDPGAVLTALPPSERSVLEPVLPELVDALALGDPFAGSSLVLDDPELSIELWVEAPDPGVVERGDKIPDPEVAFVTVDGGRLTFDPGSTMVPAGERIAEQFGLTEQRDGTWTRDLAGDPLELAVLDEGGGWHVSLAYTASEVWRAERGDPLPDTRERAAAPGAGTAAGVVEQLVDAWARGDDRAAAELVMPLDGRALYDYWPLAADFDLPGEGGEARRLVTRVEGTGLERRVVVDEIDVVLGRATGPEEFSLGAGGAPACGPAPNDPDVVARHLVELGADPFGAGSWCAPMSYSVVEREGRWYLSPVRTVLEGAVASLRSDPSPTELDPADTAGVLVVVLDRAADALTWR
jgi:hypothetical protein